MYFDWMNWVILYFDWMNWEILYFDWMNWTILHFDWMNGTILHFDWINWTILHFDWMIWTILHIDWMNWTILHCDWMIWTYYQDIHTCIQQFCGDKIWFPVSPVTCSSIKSNLSSSTDCTFSICCNKFFSQLIYGSSCSMSRISSIYKKSVNTIKSLSLKNLQHYKAP